MDRARDEAILYERIVREEGGVKTRVDIYPGLPHGFWAYYPDAGFTKKHRADSVDGLHWLLSSRRETL
jgi:acetyl esterase/lipase